MGRGQATKTGADGFAEVFGSRRGTKESDRELRARLNSRSGRPEMVFVGDRSSNVEAIGYDPLQRFLYIQFQGRDKIYTYADVDPAIHRGLLAADSIGSYINRVVIPNSRYFDHTTGLILAPGERPEKS
jgi:hypothetical protein